MNSAKFQDAKSTCKNQLHFCTLTTKGISKTSPFIIASKTIKYLKAGQRAVHGKL